MALKVNQVLIWVFLGVGVLEWFVDIIYVSTSDFASRSLERSAKVFIAIQPLFLFFIYFVYICSHNDITSCRERTKKLLLSPVYAQMMWFKMLSGFTTVHAFFVSLFGEMDESFKFLNIENSYRLQTVLELTIQTLPQMIIQSSNNNNLINIDGTPQGWSGLANFAMFLHVVMLLKNLAILVIFIIRKFIDNREEPQMRPRTSGINFSRVEKEAFSSIQSYLIDPHDDGMDNDGNTTIHQLTRFNPDYKSFESKINEFPHHLFMLNKFGQTPLDIAIQETIETMDIQKSLIEKKNNKKAEIQASVIDNAQDKTTFLIQRMQQYSSECSLKYIKKRHRLELKFEKSFSMAIKKRKTEILELFPNRSIKTVYVSVSQLSDYKQYKEDKVGLKDVLTTPLHLACQNSDIEAVRMLIVNHQFDVNVLLNNKNFMYELLQNSSYMDFSILNMIFKKKKPCINSGNKLPLNAAILKGNPYMIKMLIEFGNPHPFLVDANNKAAIHIAAAKLDIESFDALVDRGADPMMPDGDGNTILHTLCMGIIKDDEYDFIKRSVIKFDMRLSRNAVGRTPLNIIKAHSAQGVSMRGQPNFKKKIWEFFESKLQEDATFSDEAASTPLHDAIIEDDFEVVQKIIQEAETDEQGNKRQPQSVELSNLLNQRNSEGRTPLMIAIEHNQNQIINYLLDNYNNIKLDCRCTNLGETALHIACRQNNVPITTRLHEMNKKVCLMQDFKGKTPIHVATEQMNIELLQIFEDFKHESLNIKDVLGENPIFATARNGDEVGFNWFTGNNEFFQARGQQNFKGQTIEHIVCLHRKHELVDEIMPRPDTKDYFGSLPIYYSLMQDDVKMIEKYFQKGREYFELRNYKNETILHIAAKHNALQSLKIILGKAVFTPLLLKKDYKGDTCFHVAAKHGSLEVIEFLGGGATRAFFEIQNDFGLLAIEAAQEKIRLLEEAIVSDKAKNNSGKVVAVFDGEMSINTGQQESSTETDEMVQRMERCKDVVKLLQNFEEYYMKEHEWNERFDTPLNKFLDTEADANLRIFMDRPKQKDLTMNVNTFRRNQQKKGAPMQGATKVDDSRSAFAGLDEETNQM